MSQRHPEDEDGYGPEPTARHWNWQQTLFFIAVAAVAAFMFGGCTTRVYPPAPHYTGYSLEETR